MKRTNVQTFENAVKHHDTSANLHFYEGPCSKVDLESAKSRIGGEEKLLKMTQGSLL